MLFIHKHFISFQKFFGIVSTLTCKQSKDFSLSECPQRHHDTVSRATFCPQAVARSALSQDMIPFILVDRYQHFEKPAISFSRFQEGRQFICSTDIYILAYIQSVTTYTATRTLSLYTASICRCNFTAIL